MGDLSLEILIPIYMLIASIVLGAGGVAVLNKDKVFWARRMIFAALFMCGMSTGILIYQGLKYLCFHM